MSSLNNLFLIPDTKHETPVYRRKRRPAPRPHTWTGQAHKAHREALIAKLHDCAAVRRVTYQAMAEHSRLARLLGC